MGAFAPTKTHRKLKEKKSQVQQILKTNTEKKKGG